ncbi:hypothetical protein U1E44_06360 [Arenibacter sp. GZD96]|uniref:hypothetical protein n=1 Tax=Aurantibrevibacter litoralis TaxID=3106030 RepID=UPI002AFE3C18|nr:hypothetical protein [Arenibacter sp. GZD-96]MEA1785705.1 hypothetical protein [Arenibacter sp. GZD-96]
MNFEHLVIGEWILLLLLGIAFGVVGYFLGRKSAVLPFDASQWEALQNENAQLRIDLNECQQQKKIQAVDTSVIKKIPEPVYNAKAASSLLGRKVKQNDLKVIEGIGPKIEQLFHASGIQTWKELSDVQVNQCQEILDAAGARFKIHDPASWPMQAKMCAEGKWKALAQWQEAHKHGKY